MFPLIEILCGLAMFVAFLSFRAKAQLNGDTGQRVSGKWGTLVDADGRRQKSQKVRYQVSRTLSQL